MSKTSVVIIIFIIFSLIAVIASRAIQRRANAPTNTVPKNGDNSTARYSAGLVLLDLPFTPPDGKAETITTAVWFPTEEKESPYTYHLSKDYIGHTALGAQTIAKDKPFPLVIYVHGGFASGYSAAYFSEHLARSGYIVIAPDFVDTKPPDFTEQIAFSTIRKGKTDGVLQVLRAAKQWIARMNADTDFFLKYLEQHRLHHFSFVIDKMLEENKTPHSLFYESINENAIAAFGHSEGGITVLAKTGAHPISSFKDTRIKAELIFSAPAAPFEQTLNQINIPLMLMVGDKDKAALGPNLPRRLIYDSVPTPKYYIVVKNANHFAFGNPQTSPTQEEKIQSDAIIRFGTAFFDRYLKSDPHAKDVLNETHPAWAYYTREETPGEVKAWGTEPPEPSADEPPLGIGGEDGIRGIIRERIQQRLGR